MQQRVCKYFTHKLLALGWGQKFKHFFFSESSPVAYQIKEK